MNPIRIASTLTLAASMALACFSTASAQDGKSSGPPRKKVLVELYTSQGCDSCPPANEFLGELERLGFGPDRVVPVAFHVDYFNTPWADPFSSKDYSRREASYNSVQKRDDLYFTPMMMVDGRFPMLGSNRTEAIASIRKALGSGPGASLRLSLSGTGADRKLDVEVAGLAPEAVGRPLMIGVTITEGPVSTRVPSGENAGKTLVEHFAVRSFAYQTARLKASESKELTFPVKMGEGWAAGSCRVAAFVQDFDNGKIYQAESIPWEPRATPRR